MPRRNNPVKSSSSPSTPLGYGVEVLSHCTDKFDYESKQCEGVFLSNGNMERTCGDACSFIMRKSGAGDPPFLHDEMLTNEIEKLMLRRSRGTLRRDGP